MDFGLNEQQQQLQNSIDRFVQDEYGFDARRKIVASEAGWSADHWRTFADLGLLALPFAEEEGGIGGTGVDTMVVMEAFGKGLVVEPFLPTVVLCGSLLKLAASPDQRAELVPGIIAGERRLAFAHGERRARHDLGHVEATAKADGDGFVLDGAKSVVLGAPSATDFIVSARTAAGISLFLVPADAAGLSLRPYATIDGQRAAEVMLANVRVGREALLGPDGGALPAIEHAVDIAVAAICAEAVGCMQATFERTRDYLNTREQFGTRIGNFQALQHALVDMFIELEQSRSMAIVAAVQCDLADAAARRRALSAAKVQIDKSGRIVGQSAVQLHGGMGMTEEMQIGHYFKRLTAIAQTFGDADHHLARFQAA
ncbi:alkylation response protein AidB-like acyl-CoA dehydrogenase [Stella humosa]|uniref:Alkylation response protein AidB-like acyl-CoA dehydrogenase n=1 Tax=Stella humosa TaxID=94 RepID=A0A3N1M1B1_9PROT|nr:acyl-CoA dehydrogenase family protein [Stella humosa]ROP99491.1 alkylation response protein AidB-like acyl-CoA dehydrogenase [Stella humosa]BBK31296.1 pimeloyl-CoA dehydrogenase small subunit [Stella humosa]